MYYVFVPTGLSSRGGDVAVYVFDIYRPSWPTPFYSVLVSVSVFMTLSTVFHSMNSPDKSLLSHSIFPTSLCLIGSLNYISVYENLSQP